MQLETAKVDSDHFQQLLYLSQIQGGPFLLLN